MKQRWLNILSRPRQIFKVTNLTERCRDNGAEDATEADCHYIVKYFDSDDDEFLNFQDFLQVMMPCDDSYLRAQIAQRPNYEIDRNEFLDEEIEKQLTKLFEKEIALN